MVLQLEIMSIRRFVQLLMLGLGCAERAARPRQPNILLILTDDQDTHMHSLDYMPMVKKHLIFEGTTFPRHYCTVALCCPSRVNLLTGMMAHNTNVTDIWGPYGMLSTSLWRDSLQGGHGNTS